MHEALEREVIAGQSELVDEVIDLAIDYASEGYTLVLEMDGRVIARAEFPVVEALDAAEPVIE